VIRLVNEYRHVQVAVTLLLTSLLHILEEIPS
jgi:hypothetical protein